MKISILILSCCFYLFPPKLFSQETIKTESPVLFTDKDYCISGDTIWFKLWFPDHKNSNENIGRVLLESLNGSLISSTIVKTNESWGQGFLFIPDSLKTSQYFITAFRKSQQNLAQFNLQPKSLFVYNRFDNFIERIEITGEPRVQQTKLGDSEITLKTEKHSYQKREKVEVAVHFNSDLKIKKALLKATLTDPFTQQFKGNYSFNYRGRQMKPPDILEHDGFIVSGKVVDLQNNPQQNVLVTLSIVHHPIYFDYYLTGENGEFYFFLSNATGQTKIYLQTFSRENKQVAIEFAQNYPDRLNTEKKMIQCTVEQSRFTKKIIQGNYINRLFQESIPVATDFFEMPILLEGEFYGHPKRRVYPAQFIDLDNFKEISRELLFGVRMIKTENEAAIRMINEKSNSMFKNEPLRLLNGIPARNNEVLENLKSEDIDYVEMNYKRRVFGDLTFNGILSIWLNENSKKLIHSDPNINEFDLDAIQVYKEPHYLTKRTTDKSRPDMRQTFVWEFINPDVVIKKEFHLSDLKGKVEIELECITFNNRIVTASKIIEVK